MPSDELLEQYLQSKRQYGTISDELKKDILRQSDEKEGFIKDDGLGYFQNKIAEKAKNMGDKELVDTFVDFWKTTWQTRGVEAGKKWSEEAQVNTNIAFAARDEVKKNAASVAFESMESVNKKDNVDFGKFEPTDEMKAARERALKQRK